MCIRSVGSSQNLSFAEFMMERLVQLCEEYLRTCVSLENVCELWEVADQAHALQLWKFCKYYAQVEFEKVKNSENFKKMSTLLKKELSDDF